MNSYKDQPTWSILYREEAKRFVNPKMARRFAQLMRRSESRPRGLRRDAPPRRLCTPPLPCDNQMAETLNSVEQALNRK